VLAVSIAAYVRFISDRRFETTPTDYLILFGVLALAVFGNADIDARDTVKLVMYSIVLLYACEVAIARIPRSRHLLQWSTLATLLTIAVRGVL
jgi:hypothetical protein